ncbi:DUF2309 family protein, partial [Ectothiorhodospiraceae bacterium WFHF3C12]|nr:DUF2309 family protein [Ectothiorhodospiraceae bacterium WFHF3C12]
MNLAVTHDPVTRASLSDAIDEACGRIAPAWPLDRAIAVNPYWGWLEQRFEDVDARLGPLAGTTLWMPPGYYRAAWASGDIGPDHLRRALAEAGSTDSEGALVAALDADQPATTALPLLSDFARGFPTGAGQGGWAETILDQISRFCAGHFDADQADWRAPGTDGLYEQWRRTFIADHGATLPDHTGALQARARALPAGDSRAAIAAVAERLGFEGDELVTLMETALLRVSGWASWCAYRRWNARLAGTDDDAIEGLLAIRLAWETLLDDGARGTGSNWARWRTAWRGPADETALAQRRRMAVWHRALEIAYQQPLTEALARPAPAAEPVPAVQAVFCIDVRSEVFRRALEDVAPGIQTRGFAGFFGLPVSYAPLGAAAERPQLPGLLAPALRVSDSCGDTQADGAMAARRRQRLARASSWRHFTSLPASAFSLVETLGLGYLGKLVRNSLSGAPLPEGWGRAGLSGDETSRLRPALELPGEDAAGAGTDIAERVLGAMGLTGNVAGLVLLVGHGSTSSNNPQAAALDCGACCGQTGEVNARALAALLNDPAVRRGLAERGMEIPASTHFLAALHNTTTDEV